MSAETVQIVLVNGPLDGETHAIPKAEATWMRTYAPVALPPVVMHWNPDGEMNLTTYWPKHLHYRGVTVDFAGWPAPSITDDGVMRYEYVGEW